MMWVLFAALVCISLLMLFKAPRGLADKGMDPVAHFQAQLAEIDADEARQMIDADSAKAARLEVQRRLLRLNQEKQAPAATDANVMSVGTVILGSMVFLAFTGGLYAVMGSPSVPAASPSPRFEAKNQLVEEGGPTVGEAIEEVRRHLQDNPRDMQGWQVLARTARSVGDYETAASAFGVLARMNPDDPAWRISELEAYTAHAGGQIPPAGRLVLAALLDAAPDHPAGQFYLGLAHLQSGNEDAARSVWIALADRSAADAPWMPAVRRQLASLGVGPPQLSDEDVAIVDAMSEQEREEFMASMLGRLQARLDSDPSDVAGWLMLARSKLALGDKTGAISALQSGISANPGEKSAELQAFLDNL